jgi:hypothetical protein
MVAQLASPVVVDEPPDAPAVDEVDAAEEPPFELDPQATRVVSPAPATNVRARRRSIRAAGAAAGGESSAISGSMSVSFAIR